MHFGLGWRVMPVIYSGLLLITVGFGFNAVQTYSVTNSIESAFAIPTWQSGIVLTAAMAIILFGGIRRLAAVSQVIVPVMVTGYFALAMGILIANISEVPAALALIFKSAFGLEQMVGGGVAAAIMQGARRGLFSNEAGLGTIPNVAATADVEHPISQGLVQSLSVFIDTIVLCTCTALIILLSSAYQPDAINPQGVVLTQLAVAEQIGGWGESLVSVFLVLFATTTIAYNCYLGENSIAYFANRPAWAIPAFRIAVLVMIAWASVQDLGTVFSSSDLTMALLAITNLLALWYLAPVGMKLLRDYEAQLRGGVSPVFKRETLPDEKIDEGSWS
jgi:AGCS family alanine or glycine:cation symporter